MEELQLKEKEKLQEKNLKSITKVQQEISLVSIVQEPLTKSENAIDKDGNLNEESINQPQTETQVAPIAEINNTEEIKNTEQSAESTEKNVVDDQPVLVEQTDSSNLIDASAIEPLGGLDLAKPGPPKAELVTTRSNTFNNSNIEDVSTLKGLKKARLNNDEDPKRIPEKPFIKRDDELCKIKKSNNLFYKNKYLYFLISIY